MQFYQSIHHFYDLIFPLEDAQVEFVKHEIGKEKGRILDVGCATGELAIELTNQGYCVNAFDLDEAMVKLAKSKGSGENPVFGTGNMLNLESMYAERSFNGIVCFGNTLVHLTCKADIATFIRSTFLLLKPGGKLLIQLLNYEGILKSQLPMLPLVENEFVRFERYYEYLASGLINFKTILQIKEEKQQVENIIQLYPLCGEELIGMLSNSGFRNIEFYGNYNRKILGSDDFPFIVKAEK